MQPREHRVQNSSNDKHLVRVRSENLNRKTHSGIIDGTWRLAAAGCNEADLAKCRVAPAGGGPCLSSRVDKTVSERRFLSRHEAAEFLGVSARLLDRWCAERKLPCVRASRRVLYDKEDLARFYEAAKQSAGA
jgi:excisionase family DNA binding protein